MKKEKIDEKPQIILPLITEVLQKQIIEIDNQKATSCIHTPPANQQQWLQKKFIPHGQRISIIYEHKIHGVSIRKISKNLERNYSTIFNIVQAYFQYGHTNRMRNFKEKATLLKFQNESKQRKKLMIRRANLRKQARRGGRNPAPKTFRSPVISMSDDMLSVNLVEERAAIKNQDASAINE